MQKLEWDSDGGMLLGLVMVSPGWPGAVRGVLPPAEGAPGFGLPLLTWRGGFMPLECISSGCCISMVT